MAEVPSALPPGWDCKYDAKTSRYYFINHYTRVTTWEDPRLRYRQIHVTPMHVPTIQDEHIPLQHGSPEFRRNYVYPSQNCPQLAFQMPKSIPIQDLNNISRMSSAISRASSSMANHKGSPIISQVVSRMQETSLTPAATDTENSVSKISTMFPTVTETHIRLLLKKYMKSIFPQVEETILLEALGNNENNVQKTSDALREMGYEKRDFKLTKQKTTKVEQPKLVEPKQKTIVRMKSLEEKNKMKSSLQDTYKDIPERVIVIALESVDYDESRANQILQIMIQDESNSKSSSGSTPKKEEESKVEETTISVSLRKSKSSLITPSPSVHTLQSVKLDSNKVRRTKEKNNSVREPLQENNSTDENNYKSSYLSQTIGPDSTLVKGSDSGMLLEDYISWDGPDPGLRQGNRAGLAKGPNNSLLLQRTYQARGPNSENRKGPAMGLAKGSIYSQLKSGLVGESRGK